MGIIGKADFDKWIAALTTPRETFAKEKVNISNISLGKALKKVVVAGFILGVISTIYYILLNTESLKWCFGVDFGNMCVRTIILLPIFVLAVLLLSSGICLLAAKILGGKGHYETQTHIVLLFIAPLMLVFIINNIVGSALGFNIISYIINIAIFIYSIYLLILALKEVHEYSLVEAIATLLISIIIIFIYFCFSITFLMV